ncbi:MAG TPA: pyridoxamine 5'-phosphate oxidase [Cellvibrio sp.]|nr:pyridoxamine 5'-phosphate oxidase [Cellvibrio sp.]
MARAFADISFTDSVKAAQSLYGSRESNRSFELADDPRNTLGDAEAEFIEARDSFYQATVGENGWPYVQHRGGPIGFVKVLDERTLGYADYRGNRQYISVGNINSDDRISLILMDYVNRRRIKIWGRARIVHESENMELVARLEDSHYRARIERAVIIHVEAYEWNCPQHITPRYTEDEVREIVKQVSEQQTANVHASPEKLTALGSGQLPLVITGVRQLTPRIRAFELRAPDGADLPPVSAGSHLRVPVLMAEGKTEWRHYSISSNPARRDIYEIAVQREDNGRGGSVNIHTQYELGLVLHCDFPQNNFVPELADGHSVLIAGGVGITAIKPSVQAMLAQGISCELHFAGRSKNEMAYRDRLQRELENDFYGYYSGGQRMNIEAILRKLEPESHVYVCGPQKLIDEVISTGMRLGVARKRIHSERFGVEHQASDKSFVLELPGRDQLIAVANNESVLEAIENRGLAIGSECRVGNCGQCVVKVLTGEVEHRDSVLTRAEKAEGKMCSCVSRALSERLVIEI